MIIAQRVVLPSAMRPAEIRFGAIHAVPYPAAVQRRPHRSIFRR
jgi:hypothetical protein